METIASYEEIKGSSFSQGVFVFVMGLRFRKGSSFS